MRNAKYNRLKGRRCMEAAICTRCQSTNPLFTKFCLICGLEITPQMKRTLSPAGNKQAVTKSIESTKEEQPKEMMVEVDVQEPVVETSTPQKEPSLWTRLLGRS
jgi:hypothetical protein